MCARGWAGTRCTINVDECASSPCDSVHGRCIDMENSYECLCRSGYTGRHCDERTDHCASHPCAAAGGTCVAGKDSVVCQCDAEHTGADCSVPLYSGSAHASSSAVPSKIAFLFFAHEGVHHAAAVWQRFFLSVPRERFNLYVHTAPGVAFTSQLAHNVRAHVHPDPIAIIYNRNTFSLATRNLLRFAHTHDKENAMFVLLTPSDVPLQS